MVMKEHASRRDGALCGANLETGGQNRRLRLGVFGLAIGLGAALALQNMGAPRLLRVFLFVPFFIGAFGAWQGLLRTCPGLASQGLREGTGGDEEHIADKSDLADTQRQGKRVLASAFISAATATGIFLLMP